MNNFPNGHFPPHPYINPSQRYFPQQLPYAYNPYRPYGHLLPHNPQQRNPTSYPYNPYYHPPNQHHPPPLPPRPEPPTPYPLRPDPRFPTTPTTSPSDPTTLFSPSGDYATHLLHLLPPSSIPLTTLLTTSRTLRLPTLSTVFPEDLISRALAAGKLFHESDGPRGGIWVVEPGSEEVVVALMEGLRGERKGRTGTGVVDEEGEGRWEVLGMGTGGG